MPVQSFFASETQALALDKANVEFAVNYNTRETDGTDSDFSNLGGEIRLTWDF